ncbi:methyltransferase domain-containing protein [Gammaproteobacteria bacterium]|jgi:SAM-dependent methyltransferase|nr:methyltransferase domain-containing protein [Gammaproteobacteria bacterium]
MIKNFFKFILEKKGTYLEKIYDNTSDQPYDAESIFLNIGAGNFYKKGWLSLDAETEIFSDRHQEAISNKAFIPFVIKEGARLPFDDNSVDIIYCSHVLEHLKVSDMKYIIKEFYRCLKENGLIRIAVPDADLGYRALLYQNNKYFNWNKRTRIGIEESEIDYFIDLICSAKSIFYSDSFFSLEEKLNCRLKVKNMIDDKKSKEEIFNFLIDSSSDLRFDFAGHINWFNYKKLHSILEDSSFMDIWKSSRNASISSEMQNRKYFDRTHPQFSLYVEAVK